MIRLSAGLAWKGNIYVALFLRLLLVMVLYSICRIGFYLYNEEFFPDMDAGKLLWLMWGGLKFDLVTLLYANVLYILLMVIPLDIRFNKYYQGFLQYLFFITNGLMLAANVADFIYYRFTLRRTTADILQQFENEANLGSLFLAFIADYWYAVIFWLALIFVMVVVYRRIAITGPQLKNRGVYYVAGLLAIPLIAYGIIGGMRGGFRHSTRPITLSNAAEYVSDPKDISIVLNTPFSFFRTIGKTKVQPLRYFTEREMEEIYSPVHNLQDTGTFKPRNVVVLILESFSKEFFGALNKEKEHGTYKGYTPFLDSLIQYSKTYEYSVANGRKSIDGLPSVISSIPSLGVPYFLSPYSGNRINSLASLLKDKGYHSSFFHGAPNGSMGFQAFMNLAGVEAYYGMDEYNNDEDFDGMWGIWDEKFLQFYADQLNTFEQPFVSSFFSVSSHHPFEIPVEYQNTFKGGPLVIHKCIQYTDYSLKKFFERIKGMPWYNNTLFVITADHTSSEIQFEEGRTAYGFYSVPIIFFAPDHSITGREETIAQQIDIMPSVLSYLNFDQPYVAFGRNLFSDDVTPFAFNYKDNVYQLFQDDYLLQFNGAESVALYNFREDTLLEKNILTTNQPIAQSLERKIKAVIQQYNNRMINDELTVRDQLEIRN